MTSAGTQTALRPVVRTMVLASGAVILTACALLAPLDRDGDARRAAKVTLAAYETTQQAILIYGGLPTCDAEAGVLRLCKDRDLWRRIKVVEAAASTAIARATPVLNGAEIDAGQIVAALTAIEDVRSAVGEAQSKLKGAGS